MPVRAIFFDVGDTLVQHWKPDANRALMLEALRRQFGERDWFDRFLDAQIVPARGPSEEALRQETERWTAEWFQNSQIGIDDIEFDHLRSAMSIPLDLVGALVPGTPEALRWCKRKGLEVVLVTNTLWRGDAEVRRDWERFGLSDAIDQVVSSHSCGWEKPHPAIFRRALELSATRPEEAVMVGDRLRQDIWGAKRLGIRAIWRRPLAGDPQDEVDAAPDAELDDLCALPEVVARWL